MQVIVVACAAQCKTSTMNSNVHIHMQFIHTACSDVGTNFGVGDRRGEAMPEGPSERGWGSGKGVTSPSPPARGTWGALRAPGPGRRRVPCILCRQIAFPSISVRVSYSLYG